MPEDLEIETPQVNMLKCIVCGKPMLSRTGLCAACRDRALEIGRAEMLKERTDIFSPVIVGEPLDMLIKHFHKPTRLEKLKRTIDQYTPWMVVACALYVIAQVIRSIVN